MVISSRAKLAQMWMCIQGGPILQPFYIYGKLDISYPDAFNVAYFRLTVIYVNIQTLLLPIVIEILF